MNAPTATYYLEMTDPGQLRPKHSADPRFRILEATARQWEFNRFLYMFIGAAWQWRDKLPWSDARWKAYAESPAIRTFVGYYDGSVAGYFELSAEGDSVEIIYFGLAPHFIGQGLGGALLTRAIAEAWNLQPPPRRVWVHTCSLDHPAALRNYEARGMAIYKTETTPPPAGG